MTLRDRDSASRNSVRPNFEKPILITVPGARPKVPWQDVVHRVLGPHFDCRSYPYSDFDFLLGTLSILLDLRWLAVALTTFLAAFFFRLPISLFLMAAGVLLLCGAVRHARSRRLAAVEHFATWVSNSGGGKTPHIVGDTFGCYLIGTATTVHQELRFGNIILASALLPRDFPWTPLVRGDGRRIANVRSEMAKKDMLSLFMHPSRMLADDLGDAGLNGFDQNRIIHTTRADGMCNLCKMQGISPASVHNIQLNSRRGRQLRSREHVHYYWLPFLWNMPIPEFWTMLSAARSISELEDQFDYLNMEITIRTFFESRFQWTHGRMFDQWVRATVSTYLAQNPQIRAVEDEVFKYVRHRLPTMLARAEQESFKSGERNERLVQCLRPSVAIIRLIKRATKG